MPDDGNWKVNEETSSTCGCLQNKYGATKIQCCMCLVYNNMESAITVECEQFIYLFNMESALIVMVIVFTTKVCYFDMIWYKLHVDGLHYTV